MFDQAHTHRLEAGRSRIGGPSPGYRDAGDQEGTGVLDQLGAEDTATCDVRSAADSWKHWVTALHGEYAFAMPGATGFSGTLSWRSSPVFRIVRWQAAAESLARSARAVRCAPTGTFELVAPVHGPLDVDHGDFCGAVVPGQLVMMSTDRPLRLRHGDDVDALALVMPRERIEARSSTPAGGAVSIDGRQGLGRLVRDMLLALHAERNGLGDAGFDAACDRLVDLACLAATGAEGSFEHHTESSARIRRFVRQHAADPTLTSSTLAKQTGWSLRYLQVMLAREGTTPSELIRTERLEVARSRLADPSLRDKTISRIAHDLGFGTASSFSTAFRAHFGCRPSSCRP